MITGIDHIVIAVHSLERAIASYRGLGFSVIVGGRHAVGSHNALIGFADGSYIELLSFYEESPAHPWWDLLQRRGGGLIDFCLASDDIRADHRAFQAHGVDAGELSAGGRARPDGYQVEWINNKVGAGWQGLIPFIIEDVTPRDQRLPQEREHANGVSGINTVTLAAADVARCAEVMAAVLAVEADPVEDEGLDATGVRLALGGQALEYLRPSSDRGPLSAHIITFQPALLT